MNDFKDREKAVFDSIDANNWDQAIHHARRVPINFDVWQRMPSTKPMPDDAVHKILDVLTKKPHKTNLPSFLFEYANNAPQNASSELLNRIGKIIVDHVPGSHLESQLILAHPNFKYDQEGESLKRASDFWKTYEKNVSPHHFAVIKSMFTGIPEQIKDHRGQIGSSEAYVHLIPDIKNHAKKVQELILNDQYTPKKYIKNEPHIQLFRGVGGHYGNLIWDRANYNPDTQEVDEKKFVIPTAHLSSWTTDPSIARRFSWNRGEITNQPDNKGVVISKWIPLKSVLHSGTHSTVIGHNPQHPQEEEIVIGHPEGKMTISTKNMEFQQKPTGVNYGSTDQPIIRKSENSNEIIDLAFGDKEDAFVLELNKNMKSKIVPAITALSILGVPQEDVPVMPIHNVPHEIQHLSVPKSVQSIQKEKKHLLHPDLEVIKMIESTGGENVRHKMMQHGPHAGTSAYGKFGLMPMTVIETITKNPSLSHKYPEFVGLDYQKDNDKIHALLDKNPNAEMDVANSHWKHLHDVFGNDKNKMAYAWLNGISGAKRATKDEIEAHPYVQKFNKYQKMRSLETMPIQKSELSINKPHIEKFLGFTNVPQDEESVREINAAIDSDQLHDLSNVGKFTHDSFIAGFNPDNSWLIKLEPTGQRAKSPSVKYGLQVVKEAAFYQIADKVFGLSRFTPHAILGELIKDKEHIPSVAIKMYPKVYITANMMNKSRPSSMKGILEKYRKTGDLHKMAVMLYVLGEADAHSSNTLTDGHEIKLIDHGTSFGNLKFDPQNDEAVYVPYILRAWDFKDRMSTEEKMKHMPTIDSEQVKKELTHWIFNLDEHLMMELSEKFLLDPKPQLVRLNLIKKMLKNNDPDYVINYLWTHKSPYTEKNHEINI